MKEFWLCFVPVFVAVDAVGVLPIFISLTEELSPAQRRRTLAQSLITASAVAVAFLWGGPAVLRLVGIGVADFMVAGGILLLVISVSDLLTGEKRQRSVDPETVGAVPIGVPLITGPAVLTTSVLLTDAYGVLPSGAAVLANIALAGVVFYFAVPITRRLGNAGSRTLSKIASLLLASIAVMLIRKGVTDLIRQAIE